MFKKINLHEAFLHALRSVFSISVQCKRSSYRHQGIQLVRSRLQSGVFATAGLHRSGSGVERDFPGPSCATFAATLGFLLVNRFTYPLPSYERSSLAIDTVMEKL